MNKAKHIWIYLSAFGIFFALLSWIQEMITKGLWYKGVVALVLGFVLYRLVIHKI